MDPCEAPAEHQPCAVEITLNIISGKWKGIILYRLLDGKKRFNELKRRIPNVTHRTLTLQLRELEADGILKRTVYAEVPPRVEYELTELGLSMTPILKAIYDWGVSYRNSQQEQSAAALDASGEQA